MQIEYRTGDLIDADETVIIHGCNAMGQMGSGVAEAIRQRLPFAYRVYRQVYLENGLQLGDVIWAINVVNNERPRIVGNAITQWDYGNLNRRYVDYDSVRSAIREVNHFTKLSQDGTVMIAGIGVIKAVGMPMIGSGLGRGDWSVISEIIQEESTDFQPVVYRI